MSLKDNFLDILNWMNDVGYDYGHDDILKKINMRKSGYVFNFNDHVEALIWSLLSQQRPWYYIEKNEQSLRKVFHNFDAEYIKNVDPMILEYGVTSLSCGNRRLHQQMQELRYNIGVLEHIEECGYTLHEFDEARSPKIIARVLSSDEEFKLKGIGPALAFEYLKKVGIDCVKPDVHILRMLKRFGCPVYNEYDAYDYIEALSKEINMPMIEIGTILWQYCATGYLEICTASPHCSQCRCSNCFSRK